MTLRMGWAGLLLAAGAWPMSAAWSGAAAPVVLVAAVVAPLLLLAVATLLRVPAGPVAAALVVLAGAGAYLAAGAGGGDPVPVLRDALPHLLTTARPAPATPELLLPGVLVGWLIGIWVALRTLPAPRPGAGLVAAPAGGLALYTAGALLTAGTADPGGTVAGALVVLAAGGWFGLAGPRPPLPTATRAMAPVAVCALATALLAGSVSLTDRFEPRLLVEPPRQAVEASSPLPRIAGWHQLGDRPLLRVETDPGVRLRLVTLADFTGAAWSASATYRRPGVVAAGALPAGRDRDTVTASITVDSLDGPWLPSPGHALTVSRPDVDVEPAAGSLLLRGELRPGLRYSVTASIDTPRPEDVVAAAVPAGPDVARYLSLPDPPFLFTEYARRVTFGASTPFEQAVAIEYAVREGRQHDPDAPAGSSYARLETFLFREPGSVPGAGTGTSEQFATAFAVLARAAGLPTRVVVGFTTGGPVVDGTRLVRGVDALAWPEVYFDQLGWYAFDPSPRAGPGDGPDRRLALEALDRIAEQAAAAPDPSSTAPEVAPAPTAGAPATGPFPAAAAGAGLGATVLAVLLAGIGSILAGRWWRRRRHRRAGARGAWSEVLDLLVLLGGPPPRCRPAPELAGELATLVPVPGGTTHPALVIAAAADRAAFAPAGGAGAAGSGGAWPALRHLRKAVRAAVPLRRRLAWPFDPRPLRRRR